MKALELKPDHQLAKKLQEDACKKLAVPTEARDAFGNAKRLEDKGDWSAAIAAYSRALEAGYPQPFSCHNKQGICYAKLGLHEKAFRQFDTAVHLAPGDVASLRNRARKHQLFGRLREAEQDALRAVEIKPDNAAGRKLLDDIRTLLADSAEQSFQHAQTLRLRKQFVEAIEAYTKAVESGHPNLFTCFNNRSLCHTMLGQHDQALADNNHCIKEDPTDPMGYDHRARTHMDLGKLELAEEDAIMTLELDEHFDGADEFLESVKAQLKVPVDARNAFNKATALYKQDDKWEQAAAQFLRAIKAGHNEAARCHIYRGACFEKMNRLKHSMQEYMAAVEKGQDDYRGWFTRGVTYRRMGKSREATVDCNRGMELASASILLNPGLLDEILGPDVAVAIEELSDREQHRAVRPLAASMMAKTLFAMKIWEAAAAAYTLMFKPAGSIEPMGVKILPPPQIMHQGHHDRGICYQNLDRHKEAFEDFNAAVKGQPTNSGAWFRRAQEQAALGCFHEAEADLRQAMSLSPNEPGAKKLLDVVRRELKSKKSDAEATQNALLAELEEEAERAAKKKEKKKRQKQKKKQKKGKDKAGEEEVAAPEEPVAEEDEPYDEAEDEDATGVAEYNRHPDPTGRNRRGKGGANGRPVAAKSEATVRESDSDSDPEPEPMPAPGGSSSRARAESDTGSKRGRPCTVQEAMTTNGFDRLRKNGGWQNDLCGPQPLTAISELTRQSGRSGLKLSALADSLRTAWNASSINVAALGCYIRHYDRVFELTESDPSSSVRGLPPGVKAFSASSVVVLKSWQNSTPKGGVGKSTGVESVGDPHAVSEQDAVQLLVDHIMSRSVEGKVTKMSALAGLFLNAKDKAILSRFGDLRPVLLKHDGTFRNFLRHHSDVFRITEDPRMGDCVVEVYTPVQTGAGLPADDWSTVSRKRTKDAGTSKEQRETDETAADEMEQQQRLAQNTKDKRTPMNGGAAGGAGKPAPASVPLSGTASASPAVPVPADSATGRKAKAQAKNLKAADAKELLSEMEVVKLLVDKIQQRARDGKPSTKASALAGGLFQSDGRYGDLRPVLLKYEGTIHGFLRHHHSVFLLVPVDEKGRPSSDDPIVRVKGKDSTAAQLADLGLAAAAAGASLNNPDPIDPLMAAGSSRLVGARENPWNKQIDRPNVMPHSEAPHIAAAGSDSGFAAGGSSPATEGGAVGSEETQRQFSRQFAGFTVIDTAAHMAVTAAPPLAMQQHSVHSVAQPPVRTPSGLSPPRSAYSPVRGGASGSSPLSPSRQPDSPLRMSATDMLPTAFFDDDDDDDLDVDLAMFQGGGAGAGMYGGVANPADIWGSGSSQAQVPSPGFGALGGDVGYGQSSPAYSDVGVGGAGGSSAFGGTGVFSRSGMDGGASALGSSLGSGGMWGISPATDVGIDSDVGSPFDAAIGGHGGGDRFGGGMFGGGGGRGGDTAGGAGVGVGPAPGGGWAGSPAPGGAVGPAGSAGHWGAAGGGASDSR